MDFKVGETDVSLWILLVILGGALILFAPFLDMIIIESAEEAMNLRYTGTQLFTLEDTSIISKVPVITMIVGLNNIIAVLLPLFSKTNRKDMNIEILGSSIVGIILTSLFVIAGPTNQLFTGDMSVLISTFLGMGSLTMELGPGVFLCIVGLVISTFGSILRFNDM